jgi:hypothetical protein
VESVGEPAPDSPASASVIAGGSVGISSFLGDDNISAREWSAGFALAWDLILARAELERLAADESSLAGFEAKITLREFDAGRLNMTRSPRGRD